MSSKRALLAELAANLLGKRQSCLYTGPMPRIINCYDSHVHWLGTGLKAHRLDLSGLNSPEDVKSLSLSAEHFRGDWLTGFGWNQNQWTFPEFPQRHDLDSVFPDQPVYFVRSDGHAVWCNSEAMRRLQLLQAPGQSFDEFWREWNDPPGGQSLRQDGFPTGVFLDRSMEFFKSLLPPYKEPQLRAGLKDAADFFVRQGFTHIRDLTCDLEQWQAAVGLRDRKELPLFVDQFFDAEDPDNYERALRRALQARSESNQQLQVKGVKVYYDGALGSEGAFLSEPYQRQQDSKRPSRGLCLMEPQRLRNIISETWAQNLELAVHTIGDQAAEDVVTAALEVQKSGLKGRLHLEHAELLLNSTIGKMKSLSVICHLQPSHWLSDKHWLEKKVGHLWRQAFRWDWLEKEGIEFYFGSDSPIEGASLATTMESVKDAETSGLALPPKNLWKHHSHPERSRSPETWTEIDTNGLVKDVRFKGKSLWPKVDPRQALL